MAEGFGMVTGRPGVCISTLGPGSTSLVNGVAAATLDRLPMIAISGQISTGREPYFTHQVVDHKLMFSPVTKWAERVEPDAVATTMRKALRLATAERPGAVHLTMNSNVANATATDDRVVLPPMEPAAYAGEVVRAQRDADPSALLASARRPVVVAGVAAVRQRATDPLVAFAQRIGVPVVVAPMAKDVIPEDDPHFAGLLDMACNQMLWDLLQGADLLVAAGFDPVELVKPWSVTAPVIHIDPVPNVDQVYAAQVELLGSIPSFLDWLADDYQGEAKWSETDLRAHRSRLDDAYYAGRVDGRLNPTDVIDIVRAAVPPDAIVTTDVGSHKLLVGQGWTTYEPRTSLMTNGLSSMGFSLPAAISAKLARPDRTVVCTTGDGGFAMVQGELRLAATLGVGIVVVVFCDNSLNRIELKQMVLDYPSTATRLEPTDLVMLAESMSCDGARVDDPAGLQKVMDRVRGDEVSGDGTALDRPLVIQSEIDPAQIDPAQYESQF